MEGVNIFSSIIREHSKMTKPPYYYQDIIEYTNDNLQQKINEISDQIKNEFSIEENKLRDFLDALGKERNKVDFNEFIIGGYKTEDRIYLAIKTDININLQRREGIN